MMTRSALSMQLEPHCRAIRPTRICRFSSLVDLTSPDGEVMHLPLWGIRRPFRYSPTRLGDSIHRSLAPQPRSAWTWLPRWRQVETPGWQTPRLAQLGSLPLRLVRLGSSGESDNCC